MIQFQEVLTDVFFDLDHTLWDFEKNSMLTFKKIFKEQNLPIDLEAFIAFYNPINHAYWKKYRENRISQEELRNYRLADTFSEINYKTTKHQINQISEDYILYLSSFPYLFDGTIPLLEKLKSRYNLHIITNGFEQVQHFKIKNSGLEPYFDFVFTAEQVGYKKPHPQIFIEALSQTKADPKKSLMVGDSLEADILGALAQGMHAIHFNSHQEEHHENCLIVDSLHELNAFF
ncbi:YjjG family noncanonical pyrimidine nucleotidase [Flavobacteriaceae bacterium]|nr:YjjG family noncanonical pyrimidine nucleotidase [Flavobacteriaceae bacterium]MDA9571914.1 YjjG family noncanonical pyrimidine nucleotidase [Flavobacteriaceae bacterium]